MGGWEIDLLTQFDDWFISYFIMEKQIWFKTNVNIKFKVKISNCASFKFTNSISDNTNIMTFLSKTVFFFLITFYHQIVLACQCSQFYFCTLSSYWSNLTQIEALTISPILVLFLLTWLRYILFTAKNTNTVQCVMLLAEVPLPQKIRIRTLLALCQAPVGRWTN